MSHAPAPSVPIALSLSISLSTQHWAKPSETGGSALQPNGFRFSMGEALAGERFDTGWSEIRPKAVRPDRFG